MNEYTKGEWEITEVGYPKDKEFWISCNQNVIAKIANIPTGDEQPEANAQLIAAAPKLDKACNRFLSGWGHFLDCINFGKSNLDAEAIQFMNEVPGDIKQAATAVKF